MAEAGSGPPAGWYPDPEGGPNPRYWNGEEWTDRWREPAGHAVADPSDPPRRLRPLRILAVTGLVVVGLVEVNNISADGEYLGVVDEILDGGLPSAGEIRDAEDRVDQAAIAIVVAYVFAAFAFIPWFHRAYSNLPRMGVVGLRYAPGWAIGAWFIPIFNLFRPKQIANDIDRASSPDAVVNTSAWHERAPARLLHWWWGVFLASGLLANVAARAVINAAEDDAFLTRRDALDALEQERTGFSLDVLASFLAIAAVVLAILVIRRITQAQDTVLDRLGGAGAQPGATLPSA